MDLPSQPVSRAAIESLWQCVAETTVDPRAGIFGPDSITWKINRESALFLGAGRASLLQLAHPWVAAALDQHSNLRNDPLARFHNTFRVVFTMVFGSRGQALAASRSLYRLHTRIRGGLPAPVAGYAEGSPYQANEMHALIWVFATLVDSAVMAYDAVLHLPQQQRETYYIESKTMAALFGIPAEVLPPDWNAFQAYVDDMVNSDRLGVNALSRELAYRVLHGRGSWVPVPAWYRDLTAAWMPERLRREFELPFDSSIQASAARAGARLPRLYARLPVALRLVGPFWEARSRMQHRAPGLITQASNRFWMGQPRLMFTELEGE